MDARRSVPYIPYAVILFGCFLPAHVGLLLIGLAIIARIARVFEEQP